MTMTEQAMIALPEAPASATLTANYRGYDILFTLRDFSGSDLLKKVDAAITYLEKMGAEPGKRYGKGTPATGTNGNAPTCPNHGTPMKQSQHGGWFCPQKIAEDDGTGRPVYCRQKVK